MAKRGIKKEKKDDFAANEKQRIKSVLKTITEQLLEIHPELSKSAAKKRAKEMIARLLEKSN